MECRKPQVAKRAVHCGLVRRVNLRADLQSGDVDAVVEHSALIYARGEVKKVSVHKYEKEKSLYMQNTEIVRRVDASSDSPCRLRYSIGT